MLPALKPLLFSKKPVIPPKFSGLVSLGSEFRTPTYISGNTTLQDTVSSGFGANNANRYILALVESSNHTNNAQFAFGSISTEPSATLLQRSTISSSEFAMFIANVPTGDSGTVTLSSLDAFDASGEMGYYMVNMSSPTPHYMNINSSSTTTVSDTTFNIPVGGFGIVFLAVPTGSFVSLNNGFTTDLNTSDFIIGASLQSPLGLSTTTLTATRDSTGAGFAMLTASWAGDGT